MAERLRSAGLGALTFSLTSPAGAGMGDSNTLWPDLMSNNFLTTDGTEAGDEEAGSLAGEEDLLAVASERLLCRRER